MSDGLLGKCKCCTKNDVRTNRRANLEYYREYDQQRQKTPRRKKLKQGYVKAYRRQHPEHMRAHSRVAHAVRSGLLERLACEVCGSEETHAHHDDYSRPLDVRWLCPLHHKHEHLADATC